MDVETTFHRVRDALLDDRAVPVEWGRVMNSDGLKTAGKLFAFARNGELVVKLPAARVQELITNGDGQPFDAGKGRPMREWVGLRPPDEVACAAYVTEARDFVSGLEAGNGIEGRRRR
jgi:hypothetical protein